MREKLKEEIEDIVLGIMKSKHWSAQLNIADEVHNIVNKEEFIDEIIERIKRKQLK